MKKLVVLFLLLLTISSTGCTVKKVEEVTDAEKFAIEYNIDKDNSFVYLTTKEMLDFMENGTGIIYFGFSECTWCQETISIFHEVLKEKNVKKVYYYNPKKIRDEDSPSYQQLIKQLKEYLFEEEKDKPRLYVPDIYVLEDGKVVDHDNTLAVVSGTIEDYLTDEVKEKLEKNLTNLVAKYTVKECEDC